MTIERYYSIRIRNWYPLYFSAKKAIFVSIFVLIIVCVFNLHLLIANGYTSVINGTKVECYDSDLYPLFPMWDTVSLHI
jgi:hypothetical protein